MSYEVKILPEAWEELKTIEDYYALTFDVATALRVTDHILEVIERLEQFPDSGSLTPDSWLNELGYRMVIIEKHAAIYRRLDDAVYVYHIMDMRRDYPRIFRSMLK